MDKGEEEKVISPLFSVEERNNIVRSFIEAYIRGAVKIAFPTKKEIEHYKPDIEAVSGKKVDAVALEDQSKGLFERLFSTAAGALKATQDEMQNAIDKLFTWIIILRQGERIEGEFLQIPNLQSRLSSLEERVANIERLLEELQNLIRIRGQQS